MRLNSTNTYIKIKYTNNELILEEINFLDKKILRGNLALKITMRKALDNLVWEFLLNVLKPFVFKHIFYNWNKSILNCVKLSMIISVGYLYWLHCCKNKYPCFLSWNQSFNMCLGVSGRCWMRCFNILARFSVPEFSPVCMRILYCLRKQYFLNLLIKQRAYHLRISCGIFLKCILYFRKYLILFGTIL